MQFIPVIKSLESVLPGQAESNVSAAQDAGQWPDGFKAILAKELDNDKTKVAIADEGNVQNAFPGLELAMSGNEAGLALKDISGEVREAGPGLSQQIAQQKLSPDIVLSEGQTAVGQGISGKIMEIINQSRSDQDLSATKGMADLPGSLVMNNVSEHLESELSREKLTTIEASPDKGADKAVFQKMTDSPGDYGKLSGEGINFLKETDAAGIKEKPAALSGDMEEQFVEETVGKDGNADAGKESGSFRSNQGSSALNIEKTTLQDGRIDFAHIAALKSKETVQGAIETAAGSAVDLSTEADTVSVKEVKPQTASRAFEDQLMDQLSNSVRLTMKQGGEARMRLYPESLGELKIELSVDDGVLKAKFLVNNAMVKDVIEDNFHRLRESLMNNGLKVESFSVSVDQQDAGSNLESSSLSQHEGTTIAGREDPVIDQPEDLSGHAKALSNDRLINIFT